MASFEVHDGFLLLCERDLPRISTRLRDKRRWHSSGLECAGIVTLRGRDMRSRSSFFFFHFLHSYAEEAGDGGVWAQLMQAPELLSSYSGRLGHETGAAELAQRYPTWLEGRYCFGGNRSFPESFFWRSEDGLDLGPARALRRCLRFSFLLCFARSG